MLYCAQGEADFQGLAMADPNATKLYGLWQTEVYNAPAALDGRVPKNERGNVQVPPFVSAMPEVCSLAVCQKQLLFLCSLKGLLHWNATDVVDTAGAHGIPDSWQLHKHSPGKLQVASSSCSSSSHPRACTHCTFHMKQRLLPTKHTRHARQRLTDSPGCLVHARVSQSQCAYCIQYFIQEFATIVAD